MCIDGHTDDLLEETECFLGNWSQQWQNPPVIAEGLYVVAFPSV